MKAKVQGRIASSGETGELLQQLEEPEEAIKSRKEWVEISQQLEKEVEDYQRYISEHQQRLGSVQEGTELMFVVWLCHWL